MGLNDLPLLYPFDAIEANENVDGLVDEDGLTSSVGGAGLTLGGMRLSLGGISAFDGVTIGGLESLSMGWHCRKEDGSLCGALFPRNPLNGFGDCDKDLEGPSFPNENDVLMLC